MGSTFSSFVKPFFSFSGFSTISLIVVHERFGLWEGGGGVECVVGGTVRPVKKWFPTILHPRATFLTSHKTACYHVKCNIVMS